MITIEFLGPIARESLEIEAKNLEEVAIYLQNIETVNGWLDKCAVAVNDVMCNDVTKVLKSGDKISILPPVCGG
ncbi:MAG: molybdenum cofactor biosynthesis protein MoaD [Sulfurovum sp. FS06-10]|jgi:molybdopterin synthase sulfur carrier subunit|nr:MAG: molybdenum cofactor biosynthesis protein MoaD [Sulfurovum sp. FS06-10]